MTGLDYDVSIAGQDFLLASSDKYPYQRGLQAQSKNRVDQSANPGDVSLQNWWQRSQLSFYKGLGIKYMEPPDDPAIANHSWDSNGLDLSDPNGVTLAKNMVGTVVSSSPNLTIPAATGMFVGRSSSATWYDTSMSATAYTSVPAIRVQTGCLAYGGIVFSGDIGTTVYYAPTGGGACSSLWTGAPAGVYSNPIGLWSVKGRIMASVDNALYELIGSTPGTPQAWPATATLKASDGNTKWSAVVDTPGAILASTNTFGGDISRIYKLAVDTSGALPVITTGAPVVAEMPRGEMIQNMASYLGKYLVISTSKGVRIGVVSDTGQVNYGPLLWKTLWGTTSTQAEAQFDGTAAYVATSSGSSTRIVGINLAYVDSSALTAPFWSYSTVTGIQSQGSTAGVWVTSSLPSRPFVLVGTTNTLYVASATDYQASGFIQSPWVRYNTLENKSFVSCGVRWDGQGGTIDVSTVTEPYGSSSSTTTLLTTLNTAGTANDSIGMGNVVAESMALKFTLNRGLATTTPTLRGWTMRALPAAVRRPTLQLPLICMDTEKDRKGMERKVAGAANRRYLALEKAAALSTPVTFKDYRTGETFNVLVDGIIYEKRAVAPNQVAADGGIINITLRSVS